MAKQDMLDPASYGQNTQTGMLFLVGEAGGRAEVQQKATMTIASGAVVQSYACA